jgi:hypothetical protein
VIYVISGAASTARTPLASPIFLFQSEKIPPEALELYRLETKNGRRELTVSPKRPPRLIRVNVTRLTPDRLYRIETDESLTPGEYSLSPKGANTAFRFQIY